MLAPCNLLHAHKGLTGNLCVSATCCLSNGLQHSSQPSKIPDKCPPFFLRNCPQKEMRQVVWTYLLLSLRELCQSCQICPNYFPVTSRCFDPKWLTQRSSDQRKWELSEETENLSVNGSYLTVCGGGTAAALLPRTQGGCPGNEIHLTSLVKQKSFTTTFQSRPDWHILRLPDELFTPHRNSAGRLSSL